MKKQARSFEQQFEKLKETMKSTEVTGTSGNGLVTVTFSGDKELKKINIKPECVDKDDLEGLQDLIAAACADAYKQLSQNDTGKGLGGMPLPFNF